MIKSFPHQVSVSILQIRDCNRDTEIGLKNKRIEMMIYISEFILTFQVLS